MLGTLGRMKGRKDDLLSLVLRSNFFDGDSGCSLFFAVRRLPGVRRRVVLDRLGRRRMTRLTRGSGTRAVGGFGTHPKATDGRCLRSLCHFFGLDIHQGRFHSVFGRGLSLRRIPTLSGLLCYRRRLFPVTSFCLSGRH